MQCYNGLVKCCCPRRRMLKWKLVDCQRRTAGCHWKTPTRSDTDRWRIIWLVFIISNNIGPSTLVRHPHAWFFSRETTGMFSRCPTTRPSTFLTCGVLSGRYHDGLLHLFMIISSLWYTTQSVHGSKTKNINVTEKCKKLLRYESGCEIFLRTVTKLLPQDNLASGP